jgi:hypothetical protein
MKNNQAKQSIIETNKQNTNTQNATKTIQMQQTIKEKKQKKKARNI